MLQIQQQGKGNIRNKGTSMYRIYEVAKDSILDN